MSSDNVTHIGVKIDTAPIKEFKKLVKSDKGGNLITDIAGAFMALEEIINRMTKGGLKNQVKYLEESTQIMIRSFEALAKVSVDTERIKQSKAQSGKRAARRRPTRKVLRDEADTVIALQGNLNTLKQLISYGEEHIQQIEKIDTFEQRTFAMKQAQAKLLKQQILDEDKLLEIQEQKEKAERDLSKLEEGSLEYDQKKLEVLEADVRLRQEKHKLLRKADVDTLDEVAKANYEMELKVSRANILTSKELVKEQEKQIRNQQKITKETERTKQSVGKIIKDFFSMEKLIARMSFVLTAKLSYELFDTIARLPKQSLNLWREFSDEMSKVFSLIADESDRTKKRLQNDVIELSKTYGIAAKELSGALYEIISAQVGVANASKVLNEAIKLSLAGGADVRTSAQSLVQIINAYDMGFDQVQRVADVAFQTVKYGQLTLQQYTDQMSKVVATASLLNIPIEEVSAAISTMTINGIKADQAFTALNQMLMTIAIPTERSKELMAQLGINLSISEIQAKGMGAALSELIPMLSMTGEANEELIGILFKNRTGFKAVASLLQNMDQYTEDYVRMINSAGASHEALAQRISTVEFHANRLKTTWDAFLMSFAEGKNRQIIGFYDRMTNALEIINKNLDLVFLSIRMIAVAIAVQLARKALMTLKKGIDAIGLAVTKLKVSLKEAWASATMGLSLLITLAVEALMAVQTIMSRAADAKLSKQLGLKEVANDTKLLNNEIEALDRTLGQMDAVTKLVKQFENLYNAQKNVVGSQDKLTKGFRMMTDGLKSVGIDVKNMTLDTINFTKVLDEVMRKSQEMAYDRERLQTMLSLRGLQAEYGDLVKSIGTDKGFAHMVPAGVRRKLFMNLTGSGKESVDSLLESVLLHAGGNTIEKYADKFMREATGIASSLITRKGYEEMDEGSRELVDKAADFYLSMASTMGDILSSRRAQKLSGFNMDERQAVATKTKTEKSFVDQMKSMLSPMLGDLIHLIPDTIVQELESSLQEVVGEIDKFRAEGGIELDESTRRDLQGKIKAMLEHGAFSQAINELFKSMDAFGDEAKKALDVGDVASAENAMKQIDSIFSALSQSLDVFDSGLNEISDLLDDQELLSLQMLARSARFEANIKYINSLAGKAKIDKAIDILDVRGQFGDLEGLIREAEIGGHTDVANLLKTVYDATLENMLNKLEYLVPETLPKYIEDIISLMQKKMSDGIIENEAGLRATMKEWMAGLSSDESAGISENFEEIIDRIMGRKKEPFNWRSILGIAEYETANDATIDIAQKTVATLGQVWDFYWDMELRKLQEQQDKKLAILNHEKDMMLANTNISNEQRAVLEQRYQEEQAKLQEEYEKKAAKQKKKKAIFDATIDYAKGLIALWSAEILNPVKAGILSALLSGIFATQMAMINNQKYASGGFTGSGYGRPDETGHKPAGIVHAGELVFTKDMVNKNFAALSGLFGALKSGKSFDAYAMSHIAGNTPMLIKPSKSGSYASGGLVGNAGIANLNVNLSGLRVIDDVSLAKLVMRGNKKMRLING